MPISLDLLSHAGFLATMKRIYLHLGAHKTGSTLLQRVLMNNRDALTRQGCAYIEAPVYVRRPFFRHVLDRLHHRRGGNGGGGVADNLPSGELKTSFDSMIEEYSADSIIISNEDFLGRSNLADSGGIYPNFRTIIPFIGALAEGYDIKVAYYVRRQDELIESTYIQQLHQGYMIEFEQYKNAIDMNNLHWSPILDCLAATFGQDNLSVRSFGLIREGKDIFVSDFLKNFLHLEEFNLENTDFTNYSYSSKAVEITRLCYPILDMEERKKLRNFLQRHFSNKTHGRAAFFSNEERKRIIDYYEQDNENIISRYISSETLRGRRGGRVAEIESGRGLRLPHRR